jgi:hypothetical protein
MRASRIHKNLEVANRMEPYASRLRLRLKHFDVSDPKKKQRLANARREMTKILVKKKVHPDEARRAVTRTLDIAADHLLEVLRRDQNLQDLSRSQRDLRRLIKQLDHLRLAISTLPPLAKSKLNKIVAVQDWQNFDTETLIRLIHAMADTLANSSPACIANEALRGLGGLTFTSAVVKLSPKLHQNDWPMVALINFVATKARFIIGASGAIILLVRIDSNERAPLRQEPFGQ